MKFITQNQIKRFSRLSCLLLTVIFTAPSFYAGATVINVYPQAQTRWTGSVNISGAISTSSVMYTKGGYSGTRDRAWMKFDLTVIPSGATINSVTLKYFITSMYNPSLQFRKVNNDPVTTAGTVLWGQIGTGTNYLSVSSNSLGWNTRPIPGTQIKTDVGNAVAQGWFALGMYEYSGSNYNEAYADGWNQQNKPYLVIDYTSNLADEISLDSISSPVNFDCENSYPVTLKVTNAGTNPITSVLINWSVNSQAQPNVNYVFVPPLASSSTRYVTLSTLTFNPGNHIIQATLANPNGNPDPFTLNNSKTVLLVITPQPQVYMQPVDQNIGLGGNAMFSTTGSGGSVTYQWQVSIDGGSTFSNLYNIGPYSTVTTQNLNITSATQDMNGYLFRCVIRGSCPPDAITNVVMLSVGPPVSVTAGHGYACISQSATVPIIIKDAHSVMSMNLVMNFTSLNATYNSYELNPIFNNNGNFAVTVLGGAVTLQWTGISALNLFNDTVCKLNFTYYSNTSLVFDTLTPGNCELNGASGAVLPSHYNNGNISTAEPGIVMQPGDQLAVAGQPTFFTVEVSGLPTFQWQVSIDSGVIWSNLQLTNPAYSGVQSATLWVLTPTLQMSGYRYRCLLNSCSTILTSNAANMAVIKLVRTWLDTLYTCTCFTPPEVILVPVHVSNFDSVNSVSISFFYKDAALHYDSIYWLNPVFTQPVANVVDGIPYDNFRFASLKTLGYWAVPDSVPLMILQFHVLCDTTKMFWEANACTYSTGSILFPYAFDSEWIDGFVLDGGPQVTAHPQNTSVYAGNSATFSCSGITHNSTLTFQWQSSPDGNNPWTDLPDTPPYSGVYSDVLTVYTSSTALNGYHFRCKLGGLCDPAYTSDAILTVNAPPIYASVPAIAACQGDSIMVPVMVANFAQVCKMKLTLQFDNTLYTYDGYKELNALLPVATSFSVNCIGNTITIIWEAASQGSIPGVSPFVTLKFHSVQLFEGSPFTFTSGITNCYFKTCANTIINTEYVNSTVSVHPLPVVHNVFTTYPAAGHYCTGDAGPLVQLDLTQTGVNYALYRDSVAVPGYGALEGTGFGIVFSNFTEPGLYTVQAYYPSTGCSVPMDGFVNVVADTPPQVFDMLPSGFQPYCTGGTGITIGLSGSETGIEYLLYLNNAEPPVATLSGSGLALSFGDITTQGIYTIVARIAGYQTCLRTMNGSAEISVHDPPVVSQSDIPIQCSQGGPFLLTGGLPAGGTYSGPGVSGGFFNPASVAGPGTYTLTYTYTDTFGCTGSIDKSVTVAEYPSISGSVSYNNNWATPLGNVRIILKNAANQSIDTVLSGTSAPYGQYRFNCLAPASSYSLVCSTTKLHCTDDVDAQDALRILRYSVGLDTLSAFRAKAADVNASNSVNAIDALLVVRRWVGQITGFVAGDWLFNHWAVNPVMVGNTAVIKNIGALCYGDVDGSGQPADSLLKKIPSVWLEKSGTLKVTTGSFIEVPVTLKGNVGIGSVSLIIQIPENCKDVSYIRSPLPGFIWHQEGNQVRFAWYNLEPVELKAGEALLWLGVKLNESATDAGKLDFSVDLRSVMTDEWANALSPVYLLMPAIVAEGVREQEITTVKGYSLGVNQPNPFHDFTEISYTLPVEGDVCLNILNILGEEMSVIVRSRQSAGSYRVKVERGILPAGTYIYKLVVCGGGCFMMSRRMVVME